MELKTISRDKNGRFIKGQIPWNRNILHSQETKDKISKANKGKRKGIKFSKQHKINLSKALKGRIPGFLGKHWSKESKKKLSNTNKGINNGMYGKRLEKCPNWKGGISNLPYSFDFNKELKELIRKRDNYKCQLCGMPECENINKLCIHHIDYDKKNCSPDNLITLCGKCNPKVNFKRDYWIDYFKKKIEEKE